MDAKLLKNLKILCPLVFFSILVLTVTSDSFALQQVAGKILVNVSPGYTESFQWGLFSESNIVTTVHLSAEGQGSEFLSFPDTFSIEPNQIGYVNISVSIPEDYGGKATLDPILYATEIGKNEEGNVSINLKMKKTVSLVISTQDSLVENLKNGFASNDDGFTLYLIIFIALIGIIGGVSGAIIVKKKIPTK